MSMLSPQRPGRQLMVPGDAESIARQARRRAALRRRQQEVLQIAVGVTAVGAVIALVLGVSLQAVLLAVAVVVGGGALGFRRLAEHQQARRERWVRAQAGPGIGAPRPKGGFSTTRHRSGAPVWVDRRAA